MQNPKWLVGIRALDQEYDGWYEQRGSNEDTIVKTTSRIDVPAGGASPVPGWKRIVDIANGGDGGISKVEFQRQWRRHLAEPRLPRVTFRQGYAGALARHVPA